MFRQTEMMIDLHRISRAFVSIIYFGDLHIVLLNKQTDNHLMKFPSFNYAREWKCRGNLEKLRGQNWP